ncbi:MAG: archaemetzincin family Zn-dependent metalloprotease [Chloroflexota bacterium]
MLVLCAVGVDSLHGKEWLVVSLDKVFGAKVVEGLPLVAIDDACDQGRGQYLAGGILAKLAVSNLERGAKVLGVAEVDLYAPGLNFVFGQADARLGTAVISLCRLRQEFYGLPADDQLFRDRALKEAVHEIGHTFGLGHCPDDGCVMRFSNCLADTDFKSANFCAGCRPKLLV